MESPTTMAMAITNKSYPVACALLDPAFAERPKKDVIGSFVVINKVSRGRNRSSRSSLDAGMYIYSSILSSTMRTSEAAPETTSTAPRPLTVGNVWCSAEVFEEDYRFSGKPVTDQFTKIVER